MIARSIGCCVASTVLGLSPVVHAGNWQLRVGPTVQQFRHSEPKVTEDGTHLGLSLRLARRVNAWEVEAAVAATQGENDYSGRDNLGFRDNKKSDADIKQASIRVARWFLAGQRVALYGGLGYHGWHRDVETTASLGPSLKYEWPYVMLGTKVRIHESERVSFMFDLRLIRPIDPSVSYRLPGLIDATKLDLDTEIGYRVEVPIAFRFGDANAIEIAPFYERIKLGSSDERSKISKDGRFLVTLREPASTTQTSGLNIHWLRSF